MKEYEINQRIYQLTESLQMREMVTPNVFGKYTITDESREELKLQFYNVLILPVEEELSAINMRVNSIINALRLTEVDEFNNFNGYIFKDSYRDNLVNRLVEILKIQL